MQRAAALLLLAVLVFVAYAPVRDAEFLNYDDNEYVWANPEVSGGLSADGIGWAFTESHSANWHPVTWISHMLDAELFGASLADAGEHHLANVAVHALATVLLAWLGWSLTGRWWASLLVAALFGLHPMHVESVAWISERKDTLSAAFGFGALLLWSGWARQGGALRHAAATLLFALGLMSKPILVTWPVVLLLLEFWPLRRKLPLRRRVMATLPWFALAVASGAATVAAQSSARALKDTAVIGFGDRLVNALHANLAYLGKLVAPLDLSVYYPHWATTPGLEGPSPAQTLVELLVTLAITAAAIVAWRRWALRLPLWSWLLWLLLLAPVIGIVQVGDQSMADRYTYLPSIALFAAFAGGLVLLVEGDERARPVAAGLSILLLLACGIGTWQRAGVWQNSETLFRDAVAYEDLNPTAHINLGQALARRGAIAEARPHYEKAVRLRPADPGARFNLGNALRDTGDLDGAVREYRAALEVDPAYAAAANNLGDALARQGRFPEAIAEFRRATSLDPGLAQAWGNLARALLLTADPGGAREAAERALALQPDNDGYADLLRQARAAEGTP